MLAAQQKAAAQPFALLFDELQALLMSYMSHERHTNAQCKADNLQLSI